MLQISRFRSGVFLALALITFGLTTETILAETLDEKTLNTEESRPNILFAIADDWSFGHASIYGCPWVETPSFDRVAREGLLFTRAFTPNAKCAPSRAIILTGRYSWQLEEAGNHMCVFPPKFGGFVERLSAAGYTSGFTGKGWGPGKALDASGRKRLITGKAYASRKAKPPTKAISSNDYSGNFADFLADAPEDQPWVFWYGTTEPHRGYEYQSGVRLGKSLDQIDRVPSYWPNNENSRHDMLDYAIEVEHYDMHLGKILATLETCGQLENTIIVCTSDHGMPFPRVKGQAYEHSNHIPLAIRWPKGIKNPGRVVEEFVNFADLAPTFLEAGKIDSPGPIMQEISGKSLFDVFADQTSAARDHVLVGKERHDIGRPGDAGYPIRGIRKGDWLYIENFETDRWPAGNPETGYLNCDGGAIKSDILQMRRQGSEQSFWKLCFGKRPARELYHVAEDPDCVVNLAAKTEHSDLLAELRGQMIQELTQAGDPRMSGNGAIFDAYPYTDGRTSRFHERFMAGEQLRAGWVNASDFEPEPIASSK